MFLFSIAVHSPFTCEYILLLYDGLLPLPHRDSDPDPGTDIHPRNGYSNNLVSGSGLESESESEK